MRQYMKRTCPKCHKWKPKRLYAKHRKECMGGRPIEGMQTVGGTGKEVDYKKKQKTRGKVGEKK